MFKSIRHLCLFLATMLICACGSRESQNYDYDIYEVDVNTFLWVRAEPSKNSRRLGSIQRGSEVRIYNIENGWGRLYFEGNTGYVSTDYLVLRHKLKAEPTELPEQQLAENAIQTDKDVSDQLPTSVFIEDSAGVLSETDHIRLSRVTATSGMKWHILTTSEIPREKIFDYTSERLDEFIDNLNSGKSWWGNMTGNATDSAVVVCYDATNRMLSIESKNTARKYMSLTLPHELYAAQSAVRHGRSPGEAIETLAELFLERKSHYSDRWFGVRWAVSSGSFFDYVCDEIFVENILPRDSFWHTWVFGWIFAIPFSIANTIMNMTGTLCGTLLLFIVLYGMVAFALNYFSIKYARYKAGKYVIGIFGFRIFQLLLWLTLISFVVYMQPKLENIVVMENYGYPLSTVDNISLIYTDSSVISGWFIWVLFLIGVLIKFCVNSNYALYALFPSSLQRKIYSNERKNIEYYLISDNDIELSMDVLDNDETPFTTLTFSIFTMRFIKVFIPAVPLLFVLNDSLLIYATMFMWTSVVAKTIIMTRSYTFIRSHSPV
ncbi:MAG: SH3 domain-containing protein [Duncaniella sp.]|nr:SH3 domain-containing protein [Duncaniella sp.]